MKVLPSLLAGDLGAVSTILKKHKISICHFDVMDGHFVPEISFGSFLAKCLVGSNPETKLDVHLMVSNPVWQISHFAGLDNVYRIFFHWEVASHHKRLLEKIRSYKKLAGIALNPETSPELVSWVLEFVDSVCVMSVSPGYSGQSFIESAYSKVKWLADERQKKNLRFSIVVDGGVTEEIAKKLEQMGVDECVMGTSFFK
ncbi:MAG: ribulose-phosphate 3-epimerase [Deltaproteobacteria bacterium]|nr:ribulose-phosphate 3-epimerase [Deltaproteobacteria bacterium]MCX7952068.1 ribulose-phosphate 3-epimerase [Deltaproteobacteria bacterium]